MAGGGYSPDGTGNSQNLPGMGADRFGAITKRHAKLIKQAVHAQQHTLGAGTAESMQQPVADAQNLNVLKKRGKPPGGGAKRGAPPVQDTDKDGY